MTEAFASAVTVSVPILALAAGAEARAVRDRLRRPDDEWVKKFEAHQASGNHFGANRANVPGGSTSCQLQPAGSPAVGRTAHRDQPIG